MALAAYCLLWEIFSLLLKTLLLLVLSLMETLEKFFKHDKHFIFTHWVQTVHRLLKGCKN